MDVNIEATGAEDLIRVLTRFGAEAGPAMGRALHEEADNVFRESQEQVPFRHGPLKDSGRVSPVTRAGNDYVVTISYGNSSVAYALYQHEGHRQDGSHVIQHYGNGKKGQYLTDPFNAALPGLTPALALRLQEILGHA